MTATVGSALRGCSFNALSATITNMTRSAKPTFIAFEPCYRAIVPTLQRDQAYTQFDRRKLRDDRRAFFYFRGDVRNVGPQVEAAAPRVLAIAKRFK